MKYSNVFIIAVLVSVVAAAGFVCFADDSEAVPSNSGEAFVADANALLEKAVGDGIVEVSYKGDVIEVIADSSNFSLLSINTGEFKAILNAVFVTYDTFYLDGVYYVSNHNINLSEGPAAGVILAGKAMDALCSSEPGVITVVDSPVDILKDGFEPYNGSLVVKVIADQKSIDFAKFVSEYVVLDTTTGSVSVSFTYTGVDEYSTIREVLGHTATLTADQFFGSEYAGMINTVCEKAVKAPNAISAVSFVWDVDGEYYMVAVDGFEPGEGADAFQRLVSGLYNSIADPLPGYNNGWDEPISAFKDPVEGYYFSTGDALATYDKDGTFITVSVRYDAKIFPGYENSGKAFVADMNRFFDATLGENIIHGTYTDDCLQFYADYKSYDGRINIDEVIEKMAKSILSSYDLFSVNGVDYVIDGTPVRSSAYQLLFVFGEMVNNVRNATPGHVQVFMSDSFAVTKSNCAPYNEAISLSADLDQFSIDFANYVTSIFSIDPETGTIDVGLTLYGADPSLTARKLAFIYSNTTARQIFDDRFVNAINMICDKLLGGGSAFANDNASIVWNLDGKQYKIALRDFKPGEGADPFQKLIRGIFDSIDDSPAGYESGWDVPISDFYDLSTGSFVVDGSVNISFPAEFGIPDVSIPVGGQLDLADRPYSVDVGEVDHATVIVVPGIDPTKVAFVVIPDEGYQLDSLIVRMGDGVYDITETKVIELTDNASVEVKVSKTGVVHVTGVVLDKSSVTVLVGKSVTLSATVIPSDADDKSVIWTTSNSSIATVNNGVVSTYKTGVVTITVTTVDGGYSASCTVNVVDYIPVTSMKLNMDSAVMKVGHVLVLEPIFTPEGAYDRVTWTSSNESVATVYHGVVRALSAGFTTITATTVTQGITATCVIEVVGEGVISVTGVTLNASSATVDVGKTFALVATVLPADATNKAVIWSTSDASIATVNNGVVTGVAPGTATITVTTVDGGFTATCDVTVVYVSVTGVTLDKDAMTVNVGSTGTLVATVLPANATDKTVIWSSSDSRIATVSNGVVTGVAPGTATITVLTADGGFTAECKVTVVSPVIHVTGVTLSETSKTIVLAEEFTLVATVLPANATDKTVYWLSKDSSVATVSNGVVRGVGLGTTEISVTTADGAYTATCEVTVVAAPIPVTGVTVGPTSTSVYVGETVTLIASVIPADATNQNVSWSSSDATIASVDKNGVVTGIAIGTATITVTTDDGGYTADCVVSVVKKDVTPVTGVKLDKTSASLKVGESLALTATVIPDDATNKNVSWSSSNSKVATVINGVVKAVADGKATITVTTEDGGYTSTCEVTVTTPAPAPASDNTLLYIGIAAAIIIVILVAAILMRRS